MIGNLNLHIGILSICWVVVTVCTVVFLVVSAISALPKMKLGATMSVVGIFIIASGITAWGSLHPVPAFTTSASSVVQNESASNPVGLPTIAPATTVAGAPLNNSGPKVGHVVFTFDDGPDIYTPSVLAELKLLHIPHAIFFDIGVKSAERPSLLLDEAQAGDLVENHTFNHKSFTGKGAGTKPLTAKQVYHELIFANDAIIASGVPRPTLWRPPYGAVNVADDNIAKSLGLQLVMDSSNDNTIIDSNDWAGDPAAEIAQNVESSLADYAGVPNGKHGGTRIVALHDGIDTAPASVEALPLIVAWMNEHNWGSTTVLPSDTTGQILAPSHITPTTSTHA